MIRILSNPITLTLCILALLPGNLLLLAGTLNYLENGFSAPSLLLAIGGFVLGIATIPDILRSARVTSHAALVYAFASCLLASLSFVMMVTIQAPDMDGLAQLALALGILLGLSAAFYLGHLADETTNRALER